MLFKTRLLACAATMVLAFSAPAMADLIDTSVTGSMNIEGYGSTNLFDPAVAQISADATEFSFVDDTQIVLADFTADTFTLLDLSSVGSFADTTYTFTDPAFAGLLLTETINAFENGVNASLVGDTITLDVPEFESEGTRYVSYNLTSSNGNPGSSDDGSSDDGQTSCTPEPASLLLFGSGLAACGLLGRRKLASV